MILRKFADNLEEVIWVISTEQYKLVYINSAYEKIWGQRCESLYNNPLSWLDSIYPEDREAVQIALEKQIQSKLDFDEEIGLRRQAFFADGLHIRRLTVFRIVYRLLLWLQALLSGAQIHPIV